MFAGFGSAEKTIITALHLTGFPLTVGEVVDAFPKSHARAIRNAAFSLAAKGVVRLSDGRPMRICSAAPLAPQQPRPRPAPLAPQQPRPAPLAPQQPRPRPAPLAPQQPRPAPLAPQQPRPAPLAPQQPRPAPLAPQQPNLDLSPADALAARLAREIDRQKRDAATPRQTTV
jgi:hypothetical protein